MLFNSDLFLAFFLSFVLVYYLLRNTLFLRNLVIVAASFLFYGWWDCRFLFLLVATCLVDFAMALALQGTENPTSRKTLVGVSIVMNLAVLGFFKYCNFFVDSFATLLSSLGVHVDFEPLEIILPVGISFYTFQTMSYVIDVYRGTIPATKNVLAFLAYVSFFPHLVAGPIVRSQYLLPQFERSLIVTRAMFEEGI